MNSPAFCDYVNVSFPPDDAPRVPVESVFADLGSYRVDTGDGAALYRFPECVGAAKYSETKRWAFVSVSGAVVALLRSADRWLEFLSICGSGPHKVTRLDLAVDLPVAGADYVPALWEKYPNHVHLTRKAVRTGVLLSSGMDGRPSGTFYAGDKRASAKVTASVYDKALEASLKRGVYLPPTTRVEVRIKGDAVAIGQGVTLRDAVDCDPAFYHYAAPALIEKPAWVAEWEPGRDLGWESNWVLGEPLARLERMVWRFPEIRRWVQLADEVPGGREFLVRQLTMRVNSYPDPAECHEPPDTSAA